MRIFKSDWCRARCKQASPELRNNYPISFLDIRKAVEASFICRSSENLSVDPMSVRRNCSATATRDGQRLTETDRAGQSWAELGRARQSWAELDRD